MGAFFAIVLSVLAIFLILLVLVQRGRGGGLAGALGGMGGSSAFGAKAGDIFTRITIITASIWIILSLTAVFWAKHRGDVLGSAGPAAPAVDEALDLMPQAERGDTASPSAVRPTEPAQSPPAEPSSPPSDNPAPPASDP
jgi:preprotein translocase subunit SecG